MAQKHETGGTYAFSQVQSEVLSGHGLVVTDHLGASLLKHAKNAGFKALDGVVLVAEHEVGVVEPLDLDVDHRRWSVLP